MLCLQGDWGCSGLDVLLNTGPDIDLSPVRISGWSMTKGSMQNLYLQSRKNFATVISGESKSRLERIKHTELTILPYPERILALAPPILLQRRMGNSNPGNTECDDVCLLAASCVSTADEMHYIDDVDDHGHDSDGCCCRHLGVLI